MWYSQNQDIPVDICVGNMSAYLNSIVQVGFKKNDFTGALGRSLTKGLSRYKLVDGYWHGKVLSDASWVMFRSMYTNGAWTDILLGKLPPFPPTDSVVRWTFQPIPVKLTPPAGLAVNNAVVQFGYAENGDPGKFYCTSRQEKVPGDGGHCSGGAVRLSVRRYRGAGSRSYGRTVRERLYRRNSGDFAANAVLPGEVSRRVEQNGRDGSDRDDRGALAAPGPPHGNALAIAASANGDEQRVTFVVGMQTVTGETLL